MTTTSSPRVKAVWRARRELDPAADVLDAIWVRHRDVTLARVVAVETPSRTGCRVGRMTSCRERGVSAAHKLAGSCGMFGFPVAGEIAGRLEDALSGPLDPSRDDFRALAGLVDALRRALDGRAPEV